MKPPKNMLNYQIAFSQVASKVSKVISNLPVKMINKILIKTISATETMATFLLLHLAANPFLKFMGAE